MNPYQPPADITASPPPSRRRKLTLLLLLPGLLIAALVVLLTAASSITSLYYLNDLLQNSALHLQAPKLIATFSLSLLWALGSAYSLGVIPAWYRHHAGSPIDTLRSIRRRLLAGLILLPGGALYMITGFKRLSDNSLLYLIVAIIVGIILFNSAIVLALILRLSKQIRATQENSEPARA